MTDMSQPVLRFAPSPTGPLHIGGVRTALFNFLYARQQGGKLLLRIEDTDRTRFVPGAEEYIQSALAWLGIEFDEGPSQGGERGPYRQSERGAAGIYQTYADQLLAQGDAYYAFDTPADLDQMREALKAEGSSVQQYNYMTRGRMKNSLTLTEDEVQTRLASGEPYVLRMKMPEDTHIAFQDVVRGEVSFHTLQLDDKILLKTDGLPTYHLANVVDDHLMGITHVIRGEEWLSSTPLHIALYRALGWGDQMPTFVHLPLILNPNGKGKMSKRQGDKLGFSVFPTQWTGADGQTSSGFREDGYLPEALLNFLALLGWSPGDDEEVMNMARLIERFSLERIGNSGTKFDLDKLNWFNQLYLREKKQASELLPLVQQELSLRDLSVPDEAFLTQAIALMQERVTVLSDFVTEATYFFQAPAQYDEKMAKKRWKADAGALMLALAEDFQALDSWEATTLEAATNAFVEAKEVGKGKVMAPLRLALTGVAGGPGVYDIAALLGREESVTRLKRAAEVLG